ncbi:MAG: LacI family DNA-binding transcriptional regulator [Chloroflexota bacterium]
MVRLSDIAARAGTSVSTVSIVLGDRPSPVRISGVTRQAVLDAARALGYTPNLAARRLRSNGAQLRTIVLAIAHPIDSRLSLIGRVVRGVEHQLKAVQDQLAALGVNVQLIVETFELGELHKLRGLTEPVWFNGILVTNTSSDDDAFLEALSPSVPLVVFQRYSRHSSVNTDSAVVGRLAAEHLIGLGHRRLGLINANAGSQAQLLRLQGFRDTLRDAGLDEPREALTADSNWARDAYEAASALLDPSPSQRPTAIFATNDLLAIGVMRAIRDRQLRIPDDVAVVGCDDAEFAAYQDPPLTTVHLPTEEMAARATAMLLDLIYQRATPPVQEMFPSRLVARQSSAARAQRDAAERSPRAADRDGERIKSDG